MHRIEDVVDRGMCIGCGGCAVATRGAIPITLSRSGIYQASLAGVSEEDRRTGSRVCPFSDEAADEDSIGTPHPSAALEQDPRVGAHTAVSVGRQNSEFEFTSSSSGGLTTWLLRKLIEDGLVDGVIHVGSADSAGLCTYLVSESVDEVETRRKSQYYSTNMADVLTAVRNNGRRYAFVGVPCFISAARRICAADDQLGGQIVFFVGIVCGHLKSQFFAESLAWQLDVEPARLKGVDFRVKNPDRPAWDYSFGAVDETGKMTVGRNLDLLGANWGLGAMQPEGCNFCDDIFAETADIVFGDAWIEPHQGDWRGANVVVSRNPVLDRLLNEGRLSAELELRELSADDAATTQAGNFRHRRLGLQVRLADDLASGQSVPQKRVAPDAKAGTRHRRALIRRRRQISRRSLAAFADARERGDLDVYLRVMNREARRYKLVDGAGRLLAKCGRLLR